MRTRVIIFRLFLFGYSVVSSFIHLRVTTAGQGSLGELRTMSRCSNPRSSKTTRTASYLLELSVSKHNLDADSCNKYDLVSVLKDLGFDQRLIVLDKLPIPAEFYAQGQWGVCLIIGFKNTATASKPLVEIISVNSTEISDKRFIDIGQITTIWEPSSQYNSSVDSYLIHLQKIYLEAFTSFEKNFPVNHFEVFMDKLYSNHQKSRPGQIKRSKHSTASQLGSDHPLQEILRLIQKAGPAMSRLIDSNDAIDYIYRGIPSDIDTSKDTKRIVGAQVIYRDFILGGRFKRFPSIFVQQSGVDSESNHSTNNTASRNNCNYPNVAIINGGWLIVDSSSRAIIEGKKFAERIMTNDFSTAPHRLTEADERIIYRLESLAMGEDIPLSSTEAEHHSSQLEIDVRHTLSTLNFSLSPEGARRALVHLGKWSESKLNASAQTFNRTHTTILNPWSKEVLSASKKLATYEKRKRDELLAQSDVMLFHGSKTHWGGRNDLTQLPVICIDAQRATFRDDAISVRPRSRTGRKVINGCKWELLIHIADVSDIYCPDIEDAEDFSILRKAAESRCMSRYDLPIGPLHLMPPQALEALSFECRKTDNADILSSNKCVTVWVYLDEESGRIIDSGVERTVIASPTSLTFDVATSLLEDSVESNISIRFQRSTQVLKIAERLLSIWNQNQVQTNIFAKKRDERLDARQRVAESMLNEDEMTDDGSQGSFRRSRGHRIVDAALDLYSFVISIHLVRAKVPFPYLAGNGVNRRSRIGTAPLRRYLDGLVQRQVLAAVCHYGGAVMNHNECSSAAKMATEVVNKIRNIQWGKRKGTIAQPDNGYYEGLKALENHVCRYGSNTMPAVSTGKENEVVILGSGLKVKCKGVRGTLHPGDRVLIKITKLDTEKGLLQVHLHEI